MEDSFLIGAGQNSDKYNKNRDIKNVRTLLTKLKNTELVANLLLQHNIISFDEKDNILSSTAGYEQNQTLVNVIIKKDWGRVYIIFEKILYQTGNHDCANELELPHFVHPNASSTSTKLDYEDLVFNAGDANIILELQSWKGEPGPKRTVSHVSWFSRFLRYLKKHKIWLMIAPNILFNIVLWTLYLSISCLFIILASLLVSIIVSILLKQVQLVNYLSSIFIYALIIAVFELFVNYSELTDHVTRFFPVILRILLSLISLLIDSKLSKGDQVLKALVMYIIGNQITFWKTIGQGDAVAVTEYEKYNPIWWPEEKMLPLSFLERKVDSLPIADIMFKYLQGVPCNNDSLEQTFVRRRITVFGLGGTGKTTAAIWYAKTFKNKYEKIFWIDSGGQEIINSFKNLITEHPLHSGIGDDLFRIKRSAQEFYECISRRKCLIIFDNAEYYNGKDGIIKDFLPLDRLSNVHVIVTSRSTQWGNVHGRIKILDLGTFSQKESIDFFTQYLIKVKVEWKKSELTELAELLGHLPLALQLSVAFLNNTDNYSGKMQNYIQKIKESNFIIEPTIFNVDDYPRSLCQTLGMSLELIKTYGEIGELAYKMLVTMSYVQPDDIEVEFLKSTENVKKGEAIEALDLLESHSLITRTKKSLRYDQVKVNLISIHRLLQKVIRCRDRNTKAQSLHKIFTCKGFLEYKLLPYSFVSNIDQFESARKELVNLLNLNVKDLLIAFKFTEAVHLSKIIYEHFLLEDTNITVSQMSSKFNYAVCLGKTENKTKAAEIFESICKDLAKDNSAIDSRASYLIDLGLHYSGFMPKKLEILFWLLWLNIKFELQHVRLTMPILLRAIENLEHLTIIESECPVILNLLSGVKNVELVSTTVQILENHRMLKDLSERITKLKLSNVKFVDVYDNVQYYVFQDSFPFSSLLELDIKCNKETRIKICMQTLPSKLKKLDIQHPNFCTYLYHPLEHPPLHSPKFLQSLNIFFSSDLDLDNLMFNCCVLNQLELTCENVFNLELDDISPTVRQLKLRNVIFSKTHDQRKRNFDKVVLLYFDLDDVDELLNCINPTTLVLEMETNQLSKLQGREVERFLDIKNLFLGLWDWKNLDFQKFKFLDYGVVTDQCVGVCFEDRVARGISLTDFVQHTLLNEN